VSLLKSVIRTAKNILASLLIGCTLAFAAAAQELVLQCDPAQTAADFTLGDVLHTVKGTFALKQGEIRFDPASGKISGEIVFDATSGNSGNKGRDRKMHKDVLESARFSEIAFRPDRVDGPVAPTGTSNVKVHGMFRIHGAEHEMTAPAEVNLASDHWTVTTHFVVPYAKWGMKNPSVLFLRVGDSVNVGFHAAGGVSPAR
jgi:polyisoprenoid-binding protein YceI